jgi:hypothetical protein
MAKPWKAICDYIFCYKKIWDSLESLLESLRIDPENLPILSLEEKERLDEYYQQSKVSRFLKMIRENLI